jgi:hypothetical protein
MSIRFAGMGLMRYKWGMQQTVICLGLLEKIMAVVNEYRCICCIALIVKMQIAGILCRIFITVFMSQ